MSEKTRKVLKILSIAVVIGLILVLIGACINLYVIHTGRQAYLFGKGHARAVMRTAFSCLAQG